MCIHSQVETDMTVKPYESEADREARRKAEDEKRQREEEAKGSNDKFRALDVSCGMVAGEAQGDFPLTLV